MGLQPLSELIRSYYATGGERFCKEILHALPLFVVGRSLGSMCLSEVLASPSFFIFLPTSTTLFYSLSPKPEGNFPFAKLSLRISEVYNYFILHFSFFSSFIFHIFFFHLLFVFLISVFIFSLQHKSLITFVVRIDICCTQTFATKTYVSHHITHYKYRMCLCIIRVGRRSGVENVEEIIILFTFNASITLLDV